MTNNRAEQSERFLALGVGFAVLVMAVAYKLFTRVYVEDALITFRYAENLANGAGFVYNLGEKVLGTTTPLYTLLLGGFGFVFGAGHIWLISDVLTALAYAGTGVGIYLSLRALKFEVWVAATGAAIWLCDFRALNYAMGGMETGLVTFFMMLSFLLLLYKRFWGMGVVLGLLQLTRPDAVFWQILMFGFLFLNDRKHLPKVAVALLAVNLPWWIFAYSYFGNVVPHSVLAKRQGQIASLSTILQNFWTSRMDYYLPTYPGKVSMVFVLLGVWRILKDLTWKSPLFLFVLYPPLYFFGLVVGKAPYFPWYYVPSTMAAEIVGTLGFAYVIGEGAKWFAGKFGEARAPMFRQAACALLSLNMAFMVSLEMRKHRSSALNEMGLRRVVGEWIAANSKPDALVAMEAIGYEGYYAHRRVFDMAGLITPKTLEYKDCSGKGFPRFLSEVKPDYIILRAFELKENSNFAWCGAPFYQTAEEKAAFETQYPVAKEFHVPHDDGSWGVHGHLVVLKRN